MIGLMMLAAAASAQDRAFTDQALRCGLKPDQIVWSLDVSGVRHPRITPNGDLDAFSFPAFKCMIDWAQRTGARMGFVSEAGAAWVRDGRPRAARRRALGGREAAGFFGRRARRAR